MDCATDLQPSTTLPRVQGYPLSLRRPRQWRTMWPRLSGRGSIVGPCRLPLPASFFVEKKDDGLCPCINYWGPNAITVKYPHPLHLVPSAIEQLHGSTIFTKLDLQSAYVLVHVRAGKDRKTALHTTSGHYQYDAWFSKRTVVFPGFYEQHEHVKLICRCLPRQHHWNPE